MYFYAIAVRCWQIAKCISLDKKTKETYTASCSFLAVTIAAGAGKEVDPPPFVRTKSWQDKRILPVTRHLIRGTELKSWRGKKVRRKRPWWPLAIWHTNDSEEAWDEHWKNYCGLYGSVPVFKIVPSLMFMSVCFYLKFVIMCHTPHETVGHLSLS